MNSNFTLFLLVIISFISCSEKKIESGKSKVDFRKKLQEISTLFIESEKNNDLKSRLDYYTTEIISMQEYQPTISGKDELKKYYSEIYDRQNIESYKRKIGEILDLGETIIEIGTFSKEYRNSELKDSVLTQNGKYWNIWKIKSDGEFILKGEALGYFHHLQNPNEVVVDLNSTSSTNSNNLELKAYNALMEKGVRERDGLLRSEFFTDNAEFMPFADSTKIGIKILKPYMIEYNSGNVKIDSINIYTYDFEIHKDFVLEYNKFDVDWRVPNFSGKTQGKGIRIWKRQEDMSLKIFREIGLHNHHE